MAETPQLPDEAGIRARWSKLGWLVPLAALLPAPLVAHAKPSAVERFGGAVQPAEDNVAIKRFRAALAAGNRPLMARLTPGGFFDSDADAKMEPGAFFDAVQGCRITSSTVTMIYLDCARKRPAAPAAKCFTDVYVVNYWNDDVSPAVASLMRMRRRTAECTLAPRLPSSN